MSGILIQMKTIRLTAKMKFHQIHLPDAIFIRRLIKLISFLSRKFRLKYAVFRFVSIVQNLVLQVFSWSEAHWSLFEMVCLLSYQQFGNAVPLRYMPLAFVYHILCNSFNS